MKKPRRTPIFVEDVEIIDAGSEGMAVAKPDEKVVFIPFGAPGDIVDIEFYKKKRNYFEGKIISIKKYSDKRTKPVCCHFGLCGGCKWQHIDYQWQLYYKQKQVKDNFDRIGKIEYPEILPIKGCENQFYYRNKLEYTFSNRKWLIDGAPTGTHSEDDVKGLGFHLPNMFDRILDIDKCYLQADPSNSIRLFIKEFAIKNNFSFYNVRTHEGFLRNLIIRSTSFGEWMVILVYGHESKDEQELLMNAIADKFPMIHSLMYVVNEKSNDTINDLQIQCYKGNPFLIEKMASPNNLHADLKFRIGPVSFFQTNVFQAEKLYKTAFELADVQGDELVYDLYTGTGTIALYFARSIKHVVGIEYIEEAIVDAKINAELNNITNAQFYVGDMAKVFTDDFIAQNGQPDIVITDPPRAGMHEKVIEQLLKIKAKKIVYVSCNPSTQARDIQLLDPLYKVLAVQPVDMFPHTQHVENVTLLQLKPNSD